MVRKKILHYTHLYTDPVESRSGLVESRSGIDRNTIWVIVEIPPEKILLEVVVWLLIDTQRIR